MTYFADLTPYVYLQSAVESKARNVGWLDGTHDFLRWNPAPRFVSALRELMETARVHQTRGWHFWS